jgi:hypothetical protein
METKTELHPDLQDASLEKACELADKLTRANLKFLGISVATTASDLSYMLEYLRLNFDLVPKK